MSRTNRFAQTFDRPSRVPVALSAGAALLVGVLVACGTKGERKPDDTVISSTDTAIVTQPESAQPPIAVASMQQGGEAVNVSFASAESLYQQRHYADATTAFRGYTERRPDNPWGHYMLGLSAWKGGDLAKSEEAFEKALSIDPHHVKSLVNLSRVLIEQKRYDDALEKLTRAADVDPESTEVHRLIGRSYVAQGKTDEAIDAYRRAIEVNELDVWSMNNLGLLLIEKQRADEAVPLLTRAVEVRSSVPVFHNNLGMALEHIGDLTGAATAYKGALAADPGYDKAKRNLARVEALQGNNRGGGKTPGN